MADRPQQTIVETIPDFSLPASTGHTLGLDSFLGKASIVFVFLDYLSERHRRLLRQIDARLEEFGAERAQVLLVMRLSARDTSQMREELDLSVPLLADENGAMARDFGAGATPGEGRSPVAVVADQRGTVLQRFDPLPEGEEAIEVLLDAVRRDGSVRVPPETDPIGSDEEFYLRVAEEARISVSEARVLVQAFLNAAAPSLGDDARAVLNELAPDGQSVPTSEEVDPEAGVEDLLQAALAESSIASGRPVEHARVVAEAFRSRADNGQLRRLEAAIEDEDVLSLFETERGELTAHHRLDGVSELSGEDSRDGERKDRSG
jgi:peroxiredoxin